MVLLSCKPHAQLLHRWILDTILYVAIIGLAVTASCLYRSLAEEREKAKRYAYTIANMLLDQGHIDHVRNHFVADFDPMVMELNIPKRGETPTDPTFWLRFARMWLPAAEKAASQFGAHPSEEGFAYALEQHYMAPRP